MVSFCLQLALLEARLAAVVEEREVAESDVKLASTTREERIRAAWNTR